jgi:pimeloyl-ACP methyl ester carboxylesterase
MTTFVLVHGAWHGGWAWTKIAPGLRAAGHAVFTPTLTGLGERSHLLTRETGIATHVDDVANVIRWEELNDVVLVGHSYGGRVIGAVADRMPERIGTLVFLDASLPRGDETGYDRLPPERREMIRRAIVERGEGWKVPPTPAAFWGIQDPADAARVDRLCTPHPARTFEERYPLTGAWERVPRKVYVVAAQYFGSQFQTYYAEVNGKPGWQTHALDCGHEVMLDRAPELLSILLALSRPGRA